MCEFGLELFELVLVLGVLDEEFFVGLLVLLELVWDLFVLVLFYELEGFECVGFRLDLFGFALYLSFVSG